MNSAELEPTTRINRDELLRLLNTMTPEQQQSITTRASIAEIEAELARLDPKLFSGVDLDKVLAATVAEMVTPKVVSPPAPRATTETGNRTKRRSIQPFSQVAALLPATEIKRPTRVTPPAPTKRAPSHGHSLAVPEPKAPRTVAELRERLSSGETPAQWSAAAHLSPQTLALLTDEEIAMLPQPYRRERRPSSNPGGVVITARPGGEAVDIHAPAVAREPRASSVPQRAAAIITCFALLFLVGVCGIYFMV